MDFYFVMRNHRDLGDIFTQIWRAKSRGLEISIGISIDASMGTTNIL